MPCRPAATLVCLLILAAAASASGATAPSSSLSTSSFTIPPLRVEDGTTYTATGPTEGTLNISIGNPFESIDRARAAVSVVPFAYTFTGSLYFAGSTENVSNETRYLHVSETSFLAEHYDYPDRDGVNVYPQVVREWTKQGLPALFGASLLQGRTLTIGDSWTVGGACAACLEPMQVRIEGPTEFSPIGTKFTAVVAFVGTRPYPLIDPATRLHMGEAHGFPLLVESRDAQRYALDVYEAGTTVIDAANLSPRSYIGPLMGQSRPFINGRPEEGSPLPYHPSWREAREGAAFDPMVSDPELEVVVLDPEPDGGVQRTDLAKGHRERVPRVDRDTRAARREGERHAVCRPPLLPGNHASVGAASSMGSHDPPVNGASLPCMLACVNPVLGRRALRAVRPRRQPARTPGGRSLHVLLVGLVLRGRRNPTHRAQRFRQRHCPERELRTNHRFPHLRAFLPRRLLSRIDSAGASRTPHLSTSRRDGVRHVSRGRGPPRLAPLRGLLRECLARREKRVGHAVLLVPRLRAGHLPEDPRDLLGREPHLTEAQGDDPVRLRPAPHLKRQGRPLPEEDAPVRDERGRLPFDPVPHALHVHRHEVRLRLSLAPPRRVCCVLRVAGVALLPAIGAAAGGVLAKSPTGVVMGARAGQALQPLAGAACAGIALTQSGLMDDLLALVANLPVILQKAVELVGHFISEALRAVLAIWDTFSPWIYLFLYAMGGLTGVWVLRETALIVFSWLIVLFMAIRSDPAVQVLRRGEIFAKMLPVPIWDMAMKKMGAVRGTYYRDDVVKNAKGV